MGTVIKFSNDSPLGRALHARKNAYFNGRKTTGDWRLYAKTAFLFSALITAYFGIISGGQLLFYLCWISMGFIEPGIGFNVMHDSGHRSFSSRKWVNALFFYSGNIFGVFTRWWKVQHNSLHHTYTNIEGKDEDIGLDPFFYIGKGTKRKIHRYQHLYCWFPVYALQSLNWIWWMDFKRYEAGKVGDLKINLKAYEHIVFWVTKIGHVFIFIVLPMMLTGKVLPVIFGYLIYKGISGLILSSVFQCAHLVDNVTVKSMEDVPKHYDWVRHELETTSGFGQKSILLAFYVGGLNNQPLHHLFPEVSHIHYRKLAPEIVDECRKQNMTYHQHRTFWEALMSHKRYLKNFATS